MLNQKRENKAAKKSLKGARRSRALLATSPVKSNPTKNAATAPEKPTKFATPAATRAEPKQLVIN